MSTQHTVRLTPLGGVGRFGRNCLLLELEEEGRAGPALLVDCGVRFVADEAPGFDLGLPDLERIAALGERLIGTVITHGHEDHIGGLPYAARENPRPIAATAFTARLIARRFERMHETLPPLDVVHAGQTRAFGPFTITWINVSHSIPDATAVLIDTPVGAIVHSGDFRVDDDPVLGAPTDLPALTQAGDRGVLCLLADSTGALLPGRNPGEKSVGPLLTQLVKEAPARAVVALFSSHMQRLALVADACRASGRRLVLLGAGLKNAARDAVDLGLLHLDDVWLDEDDIGSFPRHRLCVAVTGTQGEPEAALARLAQGAHGAVALEMGDRAILSARVIPGNERRLAEVTDALAERGVEVVDGRSAPHVSGHGYAGDLELLLAATRPRNFVALHGNARHLLAHAALARTSGLAAERVVDMRDGSSLVLSADGKVQHLPGVHAHEPLAAFGEVEMFTRELVRVRRRMGTSGVLLVVDDDPVRIVQRGIAPALSTELVRALETLAPSALSAAGTADEPAAVRALGKCFWRAQRPPPEIILLPKTALSTG